MSSYRRAFVSGGSYFFTVVTADRRPWFSRSEHVDALRCAFRRIKKDRPFEVDAIVVLPDHVHAIWRLPEGDSDFSSRWREIKKLASRQIAPESNARHERRVWQRRFWEHAIRNEDDWRRHIDYIHFNPVRHGLVTRAGDWPWSSFRRAVERGWYEADWGTVEPVGIAGMDCD
ncbi:transposase [Nevskia sp.]|uniref:REP-associated tyrosine transposase n=1 Tax=Nevskia sp. TaxID=1929292 RepID=UPI0025D9B6F8|nr:transposase [Nevskia sp.]